MDVIPFDLMVAFCVIQIVLCFGILLFGFEKPKVEEPHKPVEFDWRKEGF